MTRKQKRMLYRIIVAALILLTAVVLQKTASGISEIFVSVLYLTAYFIIGYDVIMKAVTGIRHRRFMDENFLMAIASVGAVALGEYFESVAVMLFYQLGELFQSCAVGKSRKNIAALMDIRPDTAKVIRENIIVTVSPEEVEVGEVIQVLPGEKIPLDGIVIKGQTSVNTSAMTGESVPIDIKTGDEVLAGCVNISGAVSIRVTKPFEQSSLAKVLELVENASSNKSKSEKFITKFARWYTPLVVTCAVLLALVPQFFAENRLEWIRRALMFLVISCPCALVISVPLSFFGGIGSASSKGILIKGSGFIEALAKCDTFVFDKTGTLTKGSFAVSQINSVKLSKEVLLAVCAAVEQYSNHPLARGIVRASGDTYKKFLVSDAKEISGEGITARVEKWRVYAGNEALMKRIGIFPKDTGKTCIHIAIGNEYAGSITLTDEIKEEAKTAVSELYSLGIKETVMLTGDKREIAERVAEETGIDTVCAELLPEGKVDALEKVLENAKGTVAYVGDGINDAPVLSRADVGIAMGALGSDAAIEAADIVLMDDNPKKLVTAIYVAKKTCNIARFNIAFALGVKVVFLILGAMGITGMLGAVFADVGVSVLAVLNAMRTLKISDR